MEELDKGDFICYGCLFSIERFFIETMEETNEREI